MHVVHVQLNRCCTLPRVLRAYRPWNEKVITVPIPAFLLKHPWALARAIRYIVMAHQGWNYSIPHHINVPAPPPLLPLFLKLLSLYSALLLLLFDHILLHNRQWTAHYEIQWNIQTWTKIVQWTSIPVCLHDIINLIKDPRPPPLLLSQSMSHKHWKQTRSYAMQACNQQTKTLNSTTKKAHESCKSHFPSEREKGLDTKLENKSPSISPPAAWSCLGWWQTLCAACPQSGQLGAGHCRTCSEKPHRPHMHAASAAGRCGEGWLHDNRLLKPSSLPWPPPPPSLLSVIRPHFPLPLSEELEID